ncbi:hypothetical protein PO909_003771 [Leuciscus waleckii]
MSSFPHGDIHRNYLSHNSSLCYCTQVFVISLPSCLSLSSRLFMYLKPCLFHVRCVSLLMSHRVCFLCSLPEPVYCFCTA